MALLIKRPTSPYYYARFQVNGKDRWLSTKQKNRKKAHKEMARLVAQNRKQVSIEQQLEILTEMIAELPEHLQAAKRQEVVRSLMRTQTQKVLLTEAWTRWLANPNKDYEPKSNTLNGYGAIWKRFSKWAEAHKIQFLHELPAGDAEAYAADLWKSKVSPSTYNQHVKFLRSIFLALEKEAGLVANPWSHITSTKRSLGGGRRNLTLEELQTILAKSEGNLRLIFITGLFTGLRLADVVNLRGENVEHNPYPPDTGPRPGFLVVKPRKTERVNKVIEIPLHASVAHVLRDRKQQVGDGFLFPKEQTMHAEDHSSLSAKIQALFGSCGIKTTEEIGDGHRRRAIVRVGFHSLRHTFVSLCARAGAPLHIVQKLVGHGNPMLTSDKYLHLDKEDKQAAISGIPSFGLEAVSRESRTSKKNLRTSPVKRTVGSRTRFKRRQPSRHLAVSALPAAGSRTNP